MLTHQLSQIVKLIENIWFNYLMIILKKKKRQTTPLHPSKQTLWWHFYHQNPNPLDSMIEFQRSRARNEKGCMVQGPGFLGRWMLHHRLPRHLESYAPSLTTCPNFRKIGQEISGDLIPFYRYCNIADIN
jgi:hypothetical protein